MSTPVQTKDLILQVIDAVINKDDTSKNAEELSHEIIVAKVQSLLYPVNTPESED